MQSSTTSVQQEQRQNECKKQKDQNTTLRGRPLIIWEGGVVKIFARTIFFSTSLRFFII